MQIQVACIAHLKSVTMSQLIINNYTGGLMNTNAFQSTADIHIVGNDDLIVADDPIQFSVSTIAKNATVHTSETVVAKNATTDLDAQKAEKSLKNKIYHARRSQLERSVVLTAEEQEDLEDEQEENRQKLKELEEKRIANKKSINKLIDTRVQELKALLMADHVKYGRFRCVIPAKTKSGELLDPLNGDLIVVKPVIHTILEKFNENGFTPVVRTTEKIFNKTFVVNFVRDMPKEESQIPEVWHRMYKQNDYVRNAEFGWSPFGITTIFHYDVKEIFKKIVSDK